MIIESQAICHIVLLNIPIPKGRGLLVLDVMVPEKSGKEDYEEIYKLNPELKVIFMSGYPSDLMGQNGPLSEGLNFLTKPISPANFSKAVRNLLDGRRMTVQ